MSYKNPIFSSDPEAPAKIAAEIAAIERNIAVWKVINGIVRKYGGKDEVAGAAAIVAAYPKISGNVAAALFKPDFCGRVGIPGYKFSNANGNKRRLKLRLKELEARALQDFVECVESDADAKVAAVVDEFNSGVSP